MHLGQTCPFISSKFECFYERVIGEQIPMPGKRMEKIGDHREVVRGNRTVLTTKSSFVYAPDGIYVKINGVCHRTIARFQIPEEECCAVSDAHVFGVAHVDAYNLDRPLLLFTDGI